MKLLVATVVHPSLISFLSVALTCRMYWAMHSNMTQRVGSLHIDTGSGQGCWPWPGLLTMALARISNDCVNLLAICSIDVLICCIDWAKVSLNYRIALAVYLSWIGSPFLIHSIKFHSSLIHSVVAWDVSLCCLFILAPVWEWLFFFTCTHSHWAHHLQRNFYWYQIEKHLLSYDPQL